MEKDEKDPEASERRKHLRSPVIVFKISEEKKQEHLFGYTQNMSRAGLFISSINLRQIGQRFKISFQLPGSDTKVKCECEVIWTRRYDPKGKIESGYGVRFIDLPEHIAETIDRWLSTQP